MELYIVTGTTKGLGLALAREAHRQGHFVLSISRKRVLADKEIIHINHDLALLKGLEKKILGALNKLNLKKLKAVHLINNAAVISPIGSAMKFSLDDIQSHMQVNLVAPMYLTSIVLRAFKAKKIMQTFTNISSGAATHAIPAWSLYCASKAGLRMFTECLGTDFDQKNLRFLDFSPGVMDTDMQATIRKQTAGTFREVERFKKLKSENQLLPADVVAKAFMGVLKSPEEINQAHYDIRDLIQLTNVVKKI